ncbi:NUDIX domain-containing protein [Nocardioides cheoyonin]|uniref:NUDIX domain-containing protein n=1 Tax=Nocardioides cheoyonin TaxID=3156615 RepID=UPI0032B5DB85
MTVEIAAVVLVDKRGWLLLQERDEHAPTDPDRWSMVGGHLEPGEDHLTGAVRELEEETEIRVDPDDLTYVGAFSEPVQDVTFDVYVAGVDLTDADVVCHEGRQIVFVDPATFDDLDLTDSARMVLPGLIGSALYRELVGA